MPTVVSPFSITIKLHSDSLPELHHVFETGRSIVIGKDPTCGIVIDARGVSRKHCQLDGTGQVWTILDLDSTNGIVLNGKAFAGLDQPKMKKPIPLADGDEIGIGQSIFEDPNRIGTRSVHRNSGTSTSTREQGCSNGEADSARLVVFPG